MRKNGLAVVVLAAGKGTRMKSPRAKVLHTLLDQPILFYLLEAVRPLTPERLVLVVGFQAGEVRARFKDGAAEFVEQKALLGTGHAVEQTAPALADFAGSVLVLCGDMPLLRPETLNLLVQKHQETRAGCTLLILKTTEPRDFGRIVRDDGGRVARIVEARDASETEKTVDEYNAGVYCFDKALLFKALNEIDNLNSQREYYLTDAIQYLVDHGFLVESVVTDDADEIFGINTEQDLKKAAHLLSLRRTSAE